MFCKLSLVLSIIPFAIVLGDTSCNLKTDDPYEIQNKDLTPEINVFNPQIEAIFESKLTNNIVKNNYGNRPRHCHYSVSGNIFVGMSTTPDRVNHLHGVIESLMSSITPIHLVISIPYFSVRHDIEYPSIPDYTSLAKNGSSIQIVRTEDYGPGTKLYGVLYTQNITDDDFVMVVDDDVLLSPFVACDYVIASSNLGLQVMSRRGRYFEDACRPYYESDSKSFCAWSENHRKAGISKLSILNGVGTFFIPGRILKRLRLEFKPPAIHCLLAYDESFKLAFKNNFLNTNFSDSLNIHDSNIKYGKWKKSILQEIVEKAEKNMDMHASLPQNESILINPNSGLSTIEKCFFLSFALLDLVDDIWFSAILAKHNIDITFISDSLVWNPTSSDILTRSQISPPSKYSINWPPSSSSGLWKFEMSPAVIGRLSSTFSRNSLSIGVNMFRTEEQINNIDKNGHYIGKSRANGNIVLFAQDNIWKAHNLGSKIFKNEMATIALANLFRFNCWDSSRQQRILKPSLSNKEKDQAVFEAWLKISAVFPRLEYS